MKESINIDPDTLTEVQRRMIGGVVIKDLEGLKRYLGILVLPSHAENSERIEAGHLDEPGQK